MAFSSISSLPSAVARQRQWIDLNRQRVVGAAERVQLGDEWHQLRLQRAEPGPEDQVADLESERATPRVRVELRDRLGMRLRDLFDVHAALGAQDQHGL